MDDDYSPIMQKPNFNRKIKIYTDQEQQPGIVKRVETLCQLPLIWYANSFNWLAQSRPSDWSKAQRIPQLGIVKYTIFLDTLRNTQSSNSNIKTINNH